MFLLLAPPHDFDFTFAKKYRREKFHCKTLCRNYMNERIKQLAVQANVLHADFFDNELEVEQFAQLIVEECAKRAEVYAYMSPNFNALAEELRSMIGVAQ